MNKYLSKLQEFNEFVKADVKILENGGKIASGRKDEKPKEKQLRI